MMGCRNGEIADISTLDIEQIDGFDILGINTKNRSKDQTVKTKESKRKLVIHPACVEEGFVDFVQSVVKTDGHGPLFRDITPDYYGRRAGPITSALSDWLRNVVQIKDPGSRFTRTGTRRPRFCAIASTSRASHWSRSRSSGTFSVTVARAATTAMASVGSRR